MEGLHGCNFDRNMHGLFCIQARVVIGSGFVKHFFSCARGSGKFHGNGLLDSIFGGSVARCTEVAWRVVGRLDDMI